MGESPLSMYIEAPYTVHFPLSDPIAISPGNRNDSSRLYNYCSMGGTRCRSDGTISKRGRNGCAAG
jgi:hypothetical protein